MHVRASSQLSCPSAATAKKTAFWCLHYDRTNRLTIVLNDLAEELRRQITQCTLVRRAESMWKEH